MAIKVPASLVRHLQGGRCVLFAGAGLSAQAKLPSWGKLLGDMVQAVGAEDPDEAGAAELKKLLDAGRYLDVADECKERLGSGYAEILSRTLQVGAGPVPEAHKLVMELPFAAWITTNYDKLLEQAHFQVRGGVPKTLTHLDADTFGTLLFDGAPFILKAHGDVDKPESLIFTTRDYREIIHSNPAFNAVFSAILLTRAVLFVGYSLNDPDFRLLLDRQLTTFKKFVPERYAVMAGVGDVEREVLRRTAQIKVIPYPAGQHEELVTFLRDLQAQVAPRPATPPGEKVAGGVGPVFRAPFNPGLPLPPQASPVAGPPVFSIPPPASVPVAGAAQVEMGRAPLELLDAPPQAGPAADDDVEFAAAGEEVPARRDRDSRPAPPRQDRRTDRLFGGGRSPPPRSGAAAAPAPPHAKPPAPVAPAPPPPISLGSAPGAAAATARPTPHLVLTLGARGHRTASVLQEVNGEIIAQGHGPLTTGASLGRLQGLAQNDAAACRGIGGILADHLHPGVLQALAAALAGPTAPSIVLELDAELESKPWELLLVEGKALALQAAMSRAPVGLSAAARGRPAFHHPVKALLVGNPNGDLPSTAREVQVLKMLYGPSATVLTGGAATLEQVVAHLGATGFDVVHYAGYAWYDAQDVYLTLAGGAHLTDDLIRPALSHRPPCVLVLNSHYTAFIPSGVSAQGPETLKATAAGRIGFTDVAMRAGVGAFLGCFGSPNDESATTLAVAFHQALLEGTTAAEALHRARNGKFPANDPTPLLYALSGYGDLTLQ